MSYVVLIRILNGSSWNHQNWINFKILKIKEERLCQESIDKSSPYIYFYETFLKFDIVKFTNSLKIIGYAKNLRLLRFET